MKKILLSVAFLGATFIGAKAQNVQTILVDEDFNSETSTSTWGFVQHSQNPPAGTGWGWVATIQDGSYPFEPVGFDSGVVFSASFYDDNGQPVPFEANNSIVTPAINIPTTGVEQLVLTFDVGTFGGATAMEINIDLWEDLGGGSISYLGTLYDEQFTSQTIKKTVKIDATTIPTVFGKNIRVGFYHGGTGNTGVGFLLVDNVKLVSNSETQDLGTENFATGSLSIYPNPAKDIINIFNSVDAIENVKITDLNGRIVKEVTFDVEQAQINISDLAQGVYILNATSNGKTITKKIAKQ